MQVKMKWLKTAYTIKLGSLNNYEDKQAFMQFMNAKFDEWHAEMMNWQPSGDSLSDVVDMVEDAFTGELPDSLKPHAVEDMQASDNGMPEVEEDKPKRRGKK